MSAPKPPTCEKFVEGAEKPYICATCGEEQHLHPGACDHCGGHRTAPDGWALRQGFPPCPFCAPVSSDTPRGLDFEAAEREGEIANATGGDHREALYAALNAQCAALTRQAREEAVAAWRTEWSIYLANCDPERLADCANEDALRGVRLVLRVVREAHGRDLARDPSDAVERYKRIAAENAKYAPLVALVRRFQETVAVVKAEVGTPLTDEVHVHGREYAEAHAALEAFDLGREGDK